jgi:hypothetical protein
MITLCRFIADFLFAWRTVDGRGFWMDLRNAWKSAKRIGRERRGFPG